MDKNEHAISLSLIDAVVPEIVENRRKELQLQQQQQQQQQQQSSSSSSGTSVKNENKLSSKIATVAAPNTIEKDRSPMHQPTNTSPQSTNQITSDRKYGNINYIQWWNKLW